MVGMEKPHRMQNISSGYFGQAAHIEQYTGDEVRVSNEMFDALRGDLGSIERLVVKIEKRYFIARRGPTLPSRTIVLPVDEADELKMQIPATKFVWIPDNQQHIYNLLWSANPHSRQ